MIKNLTLANTIALNQRKFFDQARDRGMTTSQAQAAWDQGPALQYHDEVTALAQSLKKPTASVQTATASGMTPDQIAKIPIMTPEQVMKLSVGTPFKKPDGSIAYRK